MARRPRKIPIATLRSVAAAHATGFEYWGQAAGAIDWAVDADGFNHAVRRRTTHGSPQAAHACRTYRDMLVEQMRTLAGWPMSRPYINLELISVAPSWVCDVDGDFVDCPGTDGILEIAGLFTTVEVCA